MIPNNIAYIENEKEKIEIFLRKSNRAKRLSIRISQSKGIELVIPKRVSLKVANNFLFEHKNWILEKIQLVDITNPQRIYDNSEIDILGEFYIVKYTGKLRGVTYLKDNHILVSGDKNNIHNKVIAYLKKSAHNYASQKVKLYTDILGIEYNNIYIKDTSSKWGSCSSKKNLNFSWRLIMAPPKVFDYLIAHEVSHLVEMNHSKQFWLIVENLFPGYKTYKFWLKKNGHQLHKYLSIV